MYLLTRSYTRNFLPIATCGLTLPRFSEDSPCPSASVYTQDRGRTEALNPNKDAPVSPEEDEKTQLLSEGLKLLLAARERVLTLSEQRVSFSLPIFCCRCSFTRSAPWSFNSSANLAFGVDLP
jgi:hypothetical protein